ncbi:MAG: B12-binding domain-containing radical SAM protein [Proteobacteria bacterium]|nr:B12-binding domain-containing radical SAM protein [Pseudomonadota bacterium]
MKVVLINPPLVGQVNDFMGHVPFQPVSLLYLAASLRAAGISVEVVDCFAEARESQAGFSRNLSLRGLWGEALLDRIPGDASLIGISCLFGVQHSMVVHLIARIKERYPAPVVVGGDHATIVAPEFIAAGADFAVRGEGERVLPALAKALGSPERLSQIPGLVGKDFDNGPPVPIRDLDALPFPAYDLLDLPAYWEFGDAHGPLVGPYLDMITSRGCPYGCNFCASPALSGRRWRARSAAGVVEEMAHFHRTLGVTDFHIQDANYTVNRKRALEIAQGILAAGLPVTYSLPCGIKGETIRPEDLDILAASGLHYLSLAPESGSQRMLGLMNKKMDFQHMFDLVARAKALGLNTAASFIIGYPGETDQDRMMTLRLVRRMTRAGVDEFAVFIMTPLPGAKAAELFPPVDYDGMCVTPRWREDFEDLAQWRRRILTAFFLAKLRWFPGRMLMHLVNVARGKGTVKGELVARRAVRLRLRSLASRFTRTHS